MRGCLRLGGRTMNGRLRLRLGLELRVTGRDRCRCRCCWRLALIAHRPVQLQRQYARSLA